MRYLRIQLPDPSKAEPTEMGYFFVVPRKISLNVLSVHLGIFYLHVSNYPHFCRFWRYQRKKVFVHLSEGYVALMATIIIGAVLLVMTVGVTTFGSNARFTILGIEAKEQSSALAHGCADQVLAELIANPSYGGAVTIMTSTLGSCYVFPIAKNTPTEGMVILRVQGRVRDSFTNLELVFDMKDVQLASTPLSPSSVQPAAPSNFDIELISWKEIPSLP